MESVQVGTACACHMCVRTGCQPHAQKAHGLWALLFSAQRLACLLVHAPSAVGICSVGVRQLDLRSLYAATYCLLILPSVVCCLVCLLQVLPKAFQLLGCALGIGLLTLVGCLTWFTVHGGCASTQTRQHSLTSMFACKPCECFTPCVSCPVC